jgi:hypothetical protein
MWDEASLLCGGSIVALLLAMSSHASSFRVKDGAVTFTSMGNVADAELNKPVLAVNSLDCVQPLLTKV